MDLTLLSQYTHRHRAVGFQSSPWKSSMRMQSWYTRMICFYCLTNNTPQYWNIYSLKFPEMLWWALGFGCHNHRGRGKLQPVCLIQLYQGEMMVLCPVLACTWQRKVSKNKASWERWSPQHGLPTSTPLQLAKIMFNGHCSVCPLGFKSLSKPTGTFRHEFHPSIIHCMNQNFFFPLISTLTLWVTVSNPAMTTIH